MRIAVWKGLDPAFRNASRKSQFIAAPVKIISTEPGFRFFRYWIFTLQELQELFIKTSPDVQWRQPAYTRKAYLRWVVLN
jgi:hypothetical protein